MKKYALSLCSTCAIIVAVQAQNSPAITAWLQNTTQTGSYYMSGNSTPIDNEILVNCQQVAYSNNWVYIKATGVPAYPTGPFLDNNPYKATNQNKIIKLPLNPTQNTGALTATKLGAIGSLINGVSIFDYGDGGGWNAATNSLCGGAGYPQCPGGPNAILFWHKDAVVAERHGFDCSKGHPARGDYHHHQNPSAFKLDINVVSTICNLYDADGLYTIDATQHAPLIGYAMDGFPIYGAYGYKNADGTGDIVRMKSGYQLRNITNRTHWADGTDVQDGPAVSTTYPLGLFREDYEFIAHLEAEDYLDEHNGRFCITPEYPNGIYAYFATVDVQHNSAYPYVIGPNYYGNVVGSLVTSIDEEVTVYGNTSNVNNFSSPTPSLVVFPNPTADVIAIQINQLVTQDVQVDLLELSGKLIRSTQIKTGQTIGYFDVLSLYSGTYLVKIYNTHFSETRKVVLNK
jgi:hypothetical protein